MNRHEMKPLVLARIPNLNSSRASKAPEGPPTSSGRILSQALSFKVLAGVVVLLVAVAVAIPTLKRDTPSLEPTTAVEAWNPGTSAAVTDTAVPWPAPRAETPATPILPLATSVLAPATPVLATSIASEPNTLNVAPVSVPNEEPLMSAWPNASQTALTAGPSPVGRARGDLTQPASPRAETGAEAPRADVNQSMAIRPSARAY